MEFCVCVRGPASHLVSRGRRPPQPGVSGVSGNVSGALAGPLGWAVASSWTFWAGRGGMAGFDGIPSFQRLLPLPESDSLPLSLRVEWPFMPVLLRGTPAGPRSCSRAPGLSGGDGAAVGSGLRAAGSLLGSSNWVASSALPSVSLSLSLSAQALVPVPSMRGTRPAAQEGTGLLAGREVFLALLLLPSKSHLHGWSRQYSRGQEVRARLCRGLWSCPVPSPPPPARLNRGAHTTVVFLLGTASLVLGPRKEASRRVAGDGCAALCPPVAWLPT